MARRAGRIGLARTAPAVEGQRSDHRLGVGFPRSLGHMRGYRNETSGPLRALRFGLPTRAEAGSRVGLRTYTTHPANKTPAERGALTPR